MYNQNNVGEKEMDTIRETDNIEKSTIKNPTPASDHADRKWAPRKRLLSIVID